MNYGIGDQMNDNLFNDLMESVLTIEDINKEFKRPRLSYNDLVERAEMLDTGTTPQELNELLQEMVNAQLSTMEQNFIIRAIRRATKIPMGELKEALKERSGAAGRDDIGVELAQATLRRFFTAVPVVDMRDDLRETGEEAPPLGGLLIRAAGSNWTYRDTHWKRISDDEVGHFIARALLERESEGAPDIGGMAASTAIGQAQQLIRAARSIAQDVFSLTKDPLPIINVRNGELWISGKGEVELRPHRPSSYQLSCLDVVYDPDASCHEYDDALTAIFSKSSDVHDMVRHWHEFVGYAIQPKRDLASWWMLHGRGANGKTKLMETVSRLLGPDAVASMRISDLSRSQFATSSLVGAMMLLDDDVDRATLLPDGQLKQISEQKAMQGEFKGKDRFRFICRALPVLLCNGYPRTSDTSLGMARRAQVIPLRRQFMGADADPGLFNRIWRDEMPGVLNRALEGLSRLRERGNFLPPDDCQKAAGVWLQNANPTAGFVAECMTQSDRASVRRGVLWEEFQEWAAANGYRAPGRNWFYESLDGLGIRWIKSEGHHVAQGWRLLDRTEMRD